MKNLKAIMKKSPKVLALAGLLIVGLVSASAAYFFGTKNIQNTLNTGVQGVEIVEKFKSPGNWVPGQNVDKVVNATNTGTTPLLIRISYEEYWENAAGEMIEGYTKDGVTYGNIFDISKSKDGTDLLEAAIKNFNRDTVVNKEDPAISILGDDERISDAAEPKWIYYKGYYYYTALLNAGETSENWLTSVSLNEKLGEVTKEDETSYIRAACTVNRDTGELSPIEKETDSEGNKTYYDIDVPDDYAKAAADEAWNENSWIYVQTKESKGTAVLDLEGATYCLNIMVSSLPANWTDVESEWQIKAEVLGDNALPDALQTLFNSLKS